MAALGALLGLGYAVVGVRPIDASIYWQAGHAVSYYGDTWGADGAWYVYPPPVAQVLGALPWGAYLVIWMSLLALAFWAILKSWSLVYVIAASIGISLFGMTFKPADPLVLALIGNPQVLVAASIVVGLRWPIAWAAVLITKIGPGIGLVWFLARGEWRNLGLALGATALIAGASYWFAPTAWSDFARFASANAGAPPPVDYVAVPIAVRVPMAVALIWWGARTDRPWTVPIGAGWASLALYEWSMLTMVLAALPLCRWPDVASWTLPWRGHVIRPEHVGGGLPRGVRLH